MKWWLMCKEEKWEKGQSKADSDSCNDIKNCLPVLFNVAQTIGNLKHSQWTNQLFCDFCGIFAAAEAKKVKTAERIEN